MTARAESATPNGASNQAILELPPPTEAPGMLTAWLSRGEQGMLGHWPKKEKITIWLCNNNIDPKTVLIANVLPTSAALNIPTRRPFNSRGNNFTKTEYQSPKHLLAAMRHQCLNLTLIPHSYLMRSPNPVGLTTQKRLTQESQVPITAYSTDGDSVLLAMCRWY